MPALKVARLGNPILRQIALPVDLRDLTAPGGETQTFINDLIDTMRQEGGVGIAAPQVARSLQVIVIECLQNARYPDRPDLPLTVLVNPRITHYSEEKVSGWEGCLSLSDLRGFVPRSARVTVEACDREGRKLQIHADGFLAIVLQHEIDHLLGKVFLDRMTDLTKLAYQDELKAYWTVEQGEPAEV